MPSYMGISHNQLMRAERPEQRPSSLRALANLVRACACGSIACGRARGGGEGGRMGSCALQLQLRAAAFCVITLLATVSVMHASGICCRLI